MKYAIAALVAVVALAALMPNSGRQSLNACVDRIEATNNAAGVRTDYDGAYRTCAANR